MRLYPFQEKAVAECLHFLQQRKAVYNACEMGLGKCAQALTCAHRLSCKRILIICPAVVVFVWKNEIEKWGIKADEIEVISYNRAIQDSNLAALRAKKWDLLILDEAHFCVDEESLISTPTGVRSLKSLQVGDEVYSISNNETRINHITAKFKESGNEDWVNIKLSNGDELNALVWHEIKTDRGWITCKELTLSDNVYVVQENLRRSLPRLCRGRAQREEILFKGMCENLSLPSRGLVRTDARTQSYEIQQNTTESIGYAQAYRAQALDSRRQWQRNTSVRKEDEGTASFSLSEREDKGKFCSADRLDERERISYMLQDRCSDSPFETRYRSRWTKPSSIRATETRPQENLKVKTTRVESITIYKQGNARKARPSFADIEVARDHNYIANGIVVHNCKSPKAKRTKLILKHLWPKATYRICLSGTPMTQTVADCWSIFSQILPEVFGTYWEFAYRYTVVKRTPWGDKPTGIRNAEELKKIIRDNFFVRYLKADVLTELPAKTWQKIPLPAEYRVKLTPEEEAANAKYIKHLQEFFITGKPMKMAPPKSCATWRREQGLKKLPKVIEFCKELLDQDIPIVVFAYHKDVIKGLYEALESYKPVKIEGNTSQKEREAAVDAFQGERTKCFVGQIEAAGIGITLTKSCTAVFAELDWSPAKVSQAVDRLHRIGQRSNVSVYYFSVQGSMDEKLLEALIEKLSNFIQVMN